MNMWLTGRSTSLLRNQLRFMLTSGLDRTRSIVPYYKALFLIAGNDQ